MLIKIKSNNDERGGGNTVEKYFFITLHRFFSFTITDVTIHILMNRYS